MYSYIKGKVESKDENLIILENNGIGYELICSSNTVSNMPTDRQCCVYVYMQVKEDGVTMFGFESREEKEMFLKLISVSGVGGKTAIQILSGAKLNDLVWSIMNGDVKFLKNVKGIGKKTAELICVSLKEKMADMPMEEVNLPKNIMPNKEIIDDACEALISLGLKKADAMKLIKAQYTGTEEDTETLVTKCLRNMK